MAAICRGRELNMWYVLFGCVALFAGLIYGYHHLLISRFDHRRHCHDDFVQLKEVKRACLSVVAVCAFCAALFGIMESLI